MSRLQRSDGLDGCNAILKCESLSYAPVRYMRIAKRTVDF
jgi:hypothetical protein